MPDFQLQTPVAFIVFNRPDTTERVFAEIAKARPPKLLVVGDGPRANRSGEAEKVAAVRAIIDKVDWPCEVLTDYSELNLGCKIRVASGIDWIFSNVEEAIILEDDCLPDPSFFRYCEELLQKYRHDTGVGMISGDNFQFGRNKTDSSYYFSRYTHIWGWATWRRAWKNYDREAKLWPAVRAGNWLDSLAFNGDERSYWVKKFQSAHDGDIDTWDYQWTLSCWLKGMLTILPNENLISNIGFGADATHSRGSNIYAEMKTSTIRFPLRDPLINLPNQAADKYTAERMFINSLPRRLFRKIRSFQWR